MTLLDFSLILWGIVKQIFIYVSFLILPTFGLATVPVSVQDSALLLKARVTDIYSWSKKSQKYRLEESGFVFTVSDGLLEAENPEMLNVVDKGNITQKSQKEGVRYLSVSLNNKVLIESAGGRKISVKSKLYEKASRLDVYLSSQTKEGILNGLLKSRWQMEPHFWDSKESSDYTCKLNEKQQLVCSIAYMLKSKNNTPVNPR